MRVIARRHIDGSYTVWRGSQLLGKYDPKGRPIVLSQTEAA